MPRAAGKKRHGSSRGKNTQMIYKWQSTNMMDILKLWIGADRSLPHGPLLSRRLSHDFKKLGGRYSHRSLDRFPLAQGKPGDVNLKGAQKQKLPGPASLAVDSLPGWTPPVKTKSLAPKLWQILLSRKTSDSCFKCCRNIALMNNRSNLHFRSTVKSFKTLQTSLLPLSAFPLFPGPWQGARHLQHVQTLHLLLPTLPRAYQRNTRPAHVAKTHSLIRELIPRWPKKMKRRWK